MIIDKLNESLGFTGTIAIVRVILGACIFAFV